MHFLSCTHVHTHMYIGKCVQLTIYVLSACFSLLLALQPLVTLALCFQALHWRAYAELAMTVNSPEVRTIFSRSLLNCPSLDLWTTYLNFIKRVSC